jgi:hypothetical protein
LTTFKNAKNPEFLRKFTENKILQAMPKKYRKREYKGIQNKVLLRK